MSFVTNMRYFQLTTSTNKLTSDLTQIGIQRDEAEVKMASIQTAVGQVQDAWNSVTNNQQTQAINAWQSSITSAQNDVNSAQAKYDKAPAGPEKDAANKALEAAKAKFRERTNTAWNASQVSMSIGKNASVANSGVSIFNNQQKAEYEKLYRLDASLQQRQAIIQTLLSQETEEMTKLDEKNKKDAKSNAPNFGLGG